MGFNADDMDFAGEGDAGISSLFADRVSESTAFATALAAHRRRLDEPGESPVGRNVLVFHGHGGIGKSELSRRLSEWVGPDDIDTGWGPRPATAVAATVRIDLHGSEGRIDGARELASLRMQLGRWRASWPLFDVAFASYWAQTHPMDPLPVVRGDESDGGFLQATLESIAALADERGLLIDDNGASAALSILGPVVARRLAETIVGRFRSRLGITPPHGYAELFRRCSSQPTPDDPRPDILADLARLLSYELARMPAQPLVVVFIDTFERLALDERRAGESLLNRVAYAMANVLFVVTGRNHLTWSDAEGHALPHRGPDRWPLLVSGAIDEPHQHALAYLSHDDALLVLRSYRDLLSVDIADDDLERLADTSGGLPEHLRLIGHALAARRGDGRPVVADDLPASFDDLVLLLLDDVPDEAERRAIRAAALMPVCSAPLVAAAADVDEGDAERALRRPLFVPGGDTDGTRTMHDKVRAALRSSGTHVPGGWSPADWRRAGTRAVEHLRSERVALTDQYQQAMTSTDAAAQAHATHQLLRTIGTAISIVCEVDAEVGPSTPGKVGTASDAYVDWLSAALVRGPSVAGLRPYTPAASKTAYGRDILDFIEAKSRDIPHETRFDIHRRLFAESPQLSWLAGRHLGYALSNAGRWDESLAVFDELLARRPDNDFVRYQRVLRLVVARRFRQAETELGTLGGSNQERMALRLDFHGRARPEPFLRHLTEHVVRERAAGALKDALESEGIIARLGAFVLPGEPGLVAPDLRSRAEFAGHDVALRDALVAQVMTTGRRDDDTERLISIDRARNDGEIGVREALVRAADAFAGGRADDLHELHAEIALAQQPRNYQWIPVEFLLESEGLPLPEQPTEWLAPREVNLKRWRRHWHRWRAHVHGEG